MQKAKPFLKWAGGKGQLLDKFRALYPRQLAVGGITTYYEPFLGSGAVFFEIAQTYPVQSAYLYDINAELILTYKTIQKDAAKLVEHLHQIQKSYLSLGKEKRTAYFYEQRDAYNMQRHHIDYGTYSDDWLHRAAQLIFLNRTCFNGLYRVNAKGDFNTPAGNYANPKICDEYNLIAVGKLLEMAEIKHAGFEEMASDVKQSSFVYFDPPYRPISKTASFKAYNMDGFGDDDQRALALIFRQLDKPGVYLMLSNSDPKNSDPDDDFFDEIYRGYPIARVPAKRLINSDAAKRGAIHEIVVTNYEWPGHNRL